VSNDPDSNMHHPHPDFDGHLEHSMDGPLTSDNFLQRLHWAWEGAQLLYWVRRARLVDRPAEDRAASDDDSGTAQDSPRS